MQIVYVLFIMFFDRQSFVFLAWRDFDTQMNVDHTEAVSLLLYHLHKVVVKMQFPLV